MADEIPKKPQVPCNKSSTILYQAMIMFIIPLLAAIYCISQLIYRGLMGLEQMFEFNDMEHVNKIKIVFGYAIFWFFFFIMMPIFIYTFAGRIDNLDILFNQ